MYRDSNRNIISLTIYITCTVLAIFVLSVHSNDITEDAANTGFHLLEEPINPRFIAMGSTGSATSGSGFSFYNPALPFLADKTYLTIEYGQYPRADLKRSHFEIAIPLKKCFFGLSLHTESIEDIYGVNIWGNLPDYKAPFSAQFTNISFDVGFTKWDDFAFAICFNGMQDRIQDEYAYALSVSAGAVYIPIPDRLHLGLSILNIGTSTPMLGSDSVNSWGHGENLPLNSRFGVAWKDNIKKIPYKLALDIVYRNVRDSDKSFARHIKDRFTVPVGFEIKPLPPLALRIGKRFNLSTEVINFGIGLNLDPLSVDASFVIPKLIDDAEIKWLTSITYHLKTKRSKQHSKSIVIDKPLIISPKDTVSDLEPQTVKDTSDIIAEESVIIEQLPIEKSDSAYDQNELSDSADSVIAPLDSLPVDTASTDTLTDVPGSEDTFSKSKTVSAEAISKDIKETSELPADTVEITKPPAEKNAIETPYRDTTDSL